MAVPGRRGTFSFDLSRPLKNGTLLKQGAFHKAFKAREFILYPGFLVYYDNETRWRLDLTKGETLGGRLGAVKLKGATVSIARNAPRACKFGIMVDAPDPANRRKTYLMNGSSKDERDSWIEAIRKATPNSPRAQRKDVKPRDVKPKPKSSSEKDLDSPPAHPNSPPAYTARQDTACEAAVAVASCTDTLEEQKAIEEMITSVNSSLKETEVDAMERHNTATLAAISLATDATDLPQENGLDEEEAEPETSIDLILGKRKSTSDDSSSCFSGTPEANSPSSRITEFVIPDAARQEQEEGKAEENVPEQVTLDTTSRDPEESVINTMSPEPEDIVLKEVTQDTTGMNTLLSPEPFAPDMSPTPEGATEMETEESVESSKNGDTGKTTVMTMVTVACSSQGGSPDMERKAEGEGEGETGMVNGTRDEGENEEEEEETSSMNGGKRERSTSSTQIFATGIEKTTLSVNLNPYDSDNTLSDEESHGNLPELAENGLEGSPKKSPKHSPLIKIKEDRTGSGSSHSSSTSSIASNEAAQLTAPKNLGRRRSSTPFVEKKGFLYKMGGQRKTWKLRYFVLRPGAFQYFKDSKIHKPIGEVKLKNLSIFFPGIGERKQSFQFTLHTESSWNKRADYVFAGQSEREMKEWITAFKLAAGLNVSVEPEDIIED